MNEGNEKKITPPADLEAEKSVLGAMLKNQDARADAIDVVRATDF